MRVILNGAHEGKFAAVPGSLQACGFIRADAPPAALLVNFGRDPDAAIASARNFADAVPRGEEALVVNFLQAHDPGDWEAARAAALLWAFTRHAALAWAPRRIRLNAIGLGISPLLAEQPQEASGQPAGAAPAAAAAPADIAATVLALWRFPSMTGQLIRLGAP